MPTTRWKSDTEWLYEGRDRKTGQPRWIATPVDLIFGSEAELRAAAEVQAQSDGPDRFVSDFVKARAEVTNLDRFDR